MQIPQSTEGKYWFHYVDRTVTMEILEQLTNEFLIIYENSPSRLKKQLSTCKGLALNSKSVSICRCTEEKQWMFFYKSTSVYKAGYVHLQVSSYLI